MKVKVEINQLDKLVDLKVSEDDISWTVILFKTIKNLE